MHDDPARRCHRSGFASEVSSLCAAPAYASFGDLYRNSATPLYASIMGAQSAKEWVSISDIRRPARSTKYSGSGESRNIPPRGRRWLVRSRASNRTGRGP